MALFGVNPWTLMAWMGHKSITTTMQYVHVAGNHARPLPEAVLKAAECERDPDRRIVAMLGARAETCELFVSARLPERQPAEIKGKD